MTRLPLLLAAPPLLVLARFLPVEGISLALRIALATVCLLLPGALLARALRLPGAAAAFALSLGVLFVALLVVFALQSTIWLALAVLVGVAVAALPFALREELTRREWELPSLGVLALGIAYAVPVWHYAPALRGDALFHLARVRKLAEFDELSLDAVTEFADGGPHPGYAFPLWHVALALVSRLAGVDPADVVLHEAAILVPLAFLLAFEAGRALFNSPWGGFAALAGQVAITGLAPGDAGAYDALELPATAGRHLIVPATLALTFLFVRRPRVALVPALAAASLALALVHPTYALFLLIPLTGFAVVRLVLARTDLASLAGVLACVGIPTVAVLYWLAPIVEDTAGHTPSAAEVARALGRYARELNVDSADRYSLAPEVFGRSGAVAVAALISIPMAALAARTRWAAYVIGGSLPILALMTSDVLFPHFADLVSLSQARRAAGFLPFALAFAGGCVVLAGVLRGAALPVALAAGLWLQLAYPGDFGRLEDGGPAAATWAALFGGTLAIPAGLVLAGRWRPIEDRGLFAALAAALFVLPVAVHGLRDWHSPREPRVPLTPGLVQALRDRVPEGDIVFSDLETSYRVAAMAPVYVAAGPPAHVADTEDNRPYARRRDVVEFFRTGRLEIPRSYRANWLVIDRERSTLRPALRVVYSDDRYLLYRLRRL
ncbi:MAG: hypothetical protein ACRDN6_06920 [Gaiellaceae bacterium]